MNIRIAIVDDKVKTRIPLAERLQLLPGLTIAFTAGGGAEYLEIARKHDPVDVVLMDIEMPELDGIRTVELAAPQHPETKFIMLTVFDDEDRIFEAIKAGACGYILKDSSVTFIADAIKQAVELGGAPMSPGIARKAFQLLSRATVEKNAPTEEPLVSPREIEILRLQVRGLDYKAIAEELGISPNTVRKHLGNIYSKLHINSKAQAVHLAVKRRWV